MQVKRHLLLRRHRPRKGDGYRQNRIRSQTGFVWSAIQSNQQVIQFRLRREYPARYRLPDLFVDVGHRPPASQPAVALLIAVPQFQGLGGAGGRS